MKAIIFVEVMQAFLESLIYLYILGHGCVLQEAEDESESAQLSPLYIGVGLVHDL